MITLPSSSNPALRQKFRCKYTAITQALLRGACFFVCAEQMLQNNIELDLKTKLIESGTTQTEVAEKVGVSLAYVNRITKGREQIVNKTFVKMMDELGYDVELTYIKKG